MLLAVRQHQARRKGKQPRQPKQSPDHYVCLYLHLHLRLGSAEPGSGPTKPSKLQASLRQH